MPFVYSTLSNGVSYPSYKTINIGGVDLKRPIAGSFIEIKGGANVATPPHKSIVDPSGMPIHTPVGVRTEVTDAQLEQLMGHLSFRKQVEAGYFKVDNKQKVEKAVTNMQAKDASAPKTPADYGNKVKKSRSGKDVEIELPEIVVRN